MNNEDRFRKHDEWQEEMMKIIRPFTNIKHLPDVRICVNSVLFSIDFKTTRNVEKNSRDTYFWLFNHGDPVALVYNNRPSEKSNSSNILADWIINLAWDGPLAPSVNSSSGDPYYRISGGKSLTEFLRSIK